VSWEPGELVGRGAELAHLATVLDDVNAGGGRALTFVGPAGSGKTALLAGTADAAADRGFTVLSASGVEDEAGLAWAALATLCTPLLGAVERLPGAQARALRAALAIGDSGTPIDRLAVSLGALGLLAASAAQRPVLVIVDDLQWLDADSRSALGFVARRIVHDPIAMIAASRDDGRPAVGERSALHPLSADAVEELLRLHGVASSATRKRVAEAAGGSPLLALRLAAQLSPDERAGLRPLPVRLPVPSDIEQLYAAQLLELPDRTRRALLVLAADLSDDAEVAGRALTASGLSFEDLWPALDAGLLTGEPGRPRIVHPLARSAIYQGAPAAALRLAHQALAAAEGPTSPRGILHRAGSALGPDAEVAEALAAQAAAAERRGAPLAAAAQNQQAANLSPDQGRRSELLVAAARAALIGGEHHWAGNLLDSARSQGQTLALEGRRVEVRLAISEGRGEDARRLANEVDEALSATNPIGVAELISEVARWLIVREPLAALPLLDRIGELAGDAPEPTALSARLLAGMAAFLTGESKEAERLIAPWPKLLELEGPVVAGPFLAETVALYYAYSNQHGRAIALLDRLEPPMRAACAPGALLTVMAARCLVSYATDLGACVAAGLEAVALAAETGQLGLVRVAESSLTLAAATIGDREAAELAAERLLAQGDRMATVIARSSLAKLELMVGRPQDAVAQFRRLRDVLGPVNDTNVYFEPDEAAALIAVGRTDDAAALLPAIEAHAASSVWGVGMLARTRALLATDLGEAEVHFRAAHEALSASHIDAGLASVELAWGRRLRLAKRRAQARTHLEHAVALYGRVGAHGARQVAADELAAAGGTAERSRPTAEVLTAVELHAARLAVGGATNRDIAAQLFLSPRTVENHLGAVYRKLGVNGRPGLLARAALDPTLRTGDS
jgi:DNA-binding CsgD family transcriptional regulator